MNGMSPLYLLNPLICKTSFIHEKAQITQKKLKYPFIFLNINYEHILNNIKIYFVIIRALISQYLKDFITLKNYYE